MNNNNNNSFTSMSIDTIEDLEKETKELSKHITYFYGVFSELSFNIRDLNKDWEKPFKKIFLNIPNVCLFSNEYTKDNYCIYISEIILRVGNICEINKNSFLNRNIDFDELLKFANTEMKDYLFSIIYTEYVYLKKNFQLEEKFLVNLLKVYIIDTIYQNLFLYIKEFKNHIQKSIILKGLSKTFFKDKEKIFEKFFCIKRSYNLLNKIIEEIETGKINNDCELLKIDPKIITKNIIETYNVFNSEFNEVHFINIDLKEKYMKLDAFADKQIFFQLTSLLLLNNLVFILIRKIFYIIFNASNEIDELFLVVPEKEKEYFFSENNNKLQSIVEKQLNFTENDLYTINTIALFRRESVKDKGINYYSIEKIIITLKFPFGINEVKIVIDYLLLKYFEISKSFYNVYENEYYLYSCLKLYINNKEVNPKNIIYFLDYIMYSYKMVKNKNTKIQDIYFKENYNINL